MYYLYIIKSNIKTWHYIGITDNIEKRLREHNLGKTQSTKPYRPFVLIYKEQFEDKTLARKREIFLKKTAKARKELIESILGPIV